MLHIFQSLNFLEIRSPAGDVINVFYLLRLTSPITFSLVFFFFLNRNRKDTFVNGVWKVKSSQRISHHVEFIGELGWDGRVMTTCIRPTYDRLYEFQTSYQCRRQLGDLLESHGVTAISQERHLKKKKKNQVSFSCLQFIRNHLATCTVLRAKTEQFFFFL